MPKYTKDWWEKAKQFKAPLIDESQLRNLLAKCRNASERVCLILLYYTGARPSELLELRYKDIKKEDNAISISIPTLKKGIGRTIFIPLNDITQELLDFCVGVAEWRVLHGWHYPHNIRDFIYRISDKKLTPYFFRHNRMSLLAKAGVSIHTIKYFKGAKKLDSVEDYIHLGGLEVKNIVDKIK